MGLNSFGGKKKHIVTELALRPIQSTIRNVCLWFCLCVLETCLPEILIEFFSVSMIFCVFNFFVLLDLEPFYT